MSNRCILAVDGYGTRRYWATQLAHGLRVETTEDESRNHRTLYTIRTATDTFDLTLAHPTYAERVEAVRWLERYMERVDAGDLGPMRVVVPARNFDRAAILSQGLVHGDEAGTIVYSLRLEFLGARNALDPNQSRAVSSYEQARNDADAVRRFHPTGLQLGTESVEDRLYADPVGVGSRLDRIIGDGMPSSNQVPGTPGGSEIAI